MRKSFSQLTSSLFAGLHASEVLFVSLNGEASDFVRFNRGRVRQPGTVRQAAVTLQLILNRRHASADFNLSGSTHDDLARARRTLDELRSLVGHLPEDPHLLYSTESSASTRDDNSQLPSAAEVCEHILQPAEDLDLVGIYAGGPVYRALSSSLGHDHWFERRSFTFDWSLYLDGDKAVKQSYAGFHWNDADYRAKLAHGREQLERLAQPAKSISPGAYRVYFAPAAVRELLGLMAWGGFGARALATKQSPWVKMQEGARLHPQVNLSENTADSTGPQFQDAGFLKPERVVLIEQGRLTQPLVSPRSAQEYKLQTNGASAAEMPSALELAGGDLASGDALARLDTGLWVNNLWYGNFSDRPSGRVTAMTRFACFWVEKGALGAPLEVMRFDESLFHLLGNGLEALTQQADFDLDTDTYGQRSTGCWWVPGALVDGVHFTL